MSNSYVGSLEGVGGWPGPRLHVGLSIREVTSDFVTAKGDIMKKRVILVAAALATLMAFQLGYPQQERAVNDNVRMFMQAKLKHSQQVLEGLALENYDTISKHGRELLVLSNAAQWQVFQTPEYANYSSEFRESAEGIVKAAKQKNLDGATLAFVSLTMRCVECHKYVRSVAQARLEMPGERANVFANLRSVDLIGFAKH